MDDPYEEVPLWGQDLWERDLNLASANPFPDDGEYETPQDLQDNLVSIDPGFSEVEAPEEYLLLEIPERGTTVSEAKTSALPTGSSSRDLRAALRGKLIENNRYHEDAEVLCEPGTIQVKKCSQCGEVGHNKTTCGKSQTSGK
jgi:hypothetical protein